MRCPHCQKQTKFGGQVVWCPCTGWVDQTQTSPAPMTMTATPMGQHQVGRS